MSQVQSWQIQCRKCGWANSGAELKCMKCGFALPFRPGMMVAGVSAAKVTSAPSVKIAQPAGFWVRFVAFIIDVAILNAIAIGVYYVWQGTLTPATIDPNHLAASLQANLTFQLLAYQIAISLVNFFYFVGSWTILGASPAQRVFNLHIVGMDGQPIGFFRGWLRYIVLSWLGLPTAFVVGLSKSKRGLHDRIAGTFVIQYLDADRIQGNASQQLPPGLIAATDVAAPQAQPPEAIAGVAAVAAGAAGAAAATASLPPPPAIPAPAPAPAALGTPAAAAPAAAAPMAAAPSVPPAPAALLAPAPAATVQPMATHAPVPPPVFPEAPSPTAAVPPAPQALAPQVVAPPVRSAIDPVAPQSFLAPPPTPVGPAMAPLTYAPPAAGPSPEIAGGREIYSPSPGPVPAPPTIDPYPLPFSPPPPNIPAVAPPPHPAAEEPPV